jgi:parallel beta-helix repeat protein
MFHLPASWAADIFVDGNLSNDCIEGNYSIANRNCTGNDGDAYSSIQEAAQAVYAGDTVWIRQGVYREKVIPLRSGIDGNYISYRNHGSENVVIDAQNKTRDTCINVSGKKYLKFIGLLLMGAQNAAFYATDNSAHLILDGLKCQNSRFGIRLYGKESPVSFVTIKNCTVNNNSKYGIFLYKKVYDSTIGPNNHVFSNGGEQQSYGIEIGTDYPGNQDDGARRIKVFNNEVSNNDVQGIRTWNAVGVLILNNYCHHNGATGIQIENGSENIIVEKNNCEYNAQTWEYETGIWVDDTKNACVRGNFLTGNKIGLMVTASKRIILHNNIIIENNRGVPNLYNAMGLVVTRDSNDVSIVHNTLYRNGAEESSKGGITLCKDGSTERVILKNNILSETTQYRDLYIGGCQDYMSDYNLIYNTRNLNIYWLTQDVPISKYLSNSGQDIHSIIQQNPRFTSPTNKDFHLDSDSPAIDAGAFLTRTVSSGSGNIIDVSNTIYFCDGFGMRSGDLIKVGEKEVATITNIDDENHTITLDRNISWSKGDGVSYPYSNTAPDIGAHEYGDDFYSVPSTPVGLRIIWQQ